MDGCEKWPRNVSVAHDAFSIAHRALVECVTWTKFIVTCESLAANSASTSSVSMPPSTASPNSSRKSSTAKSTVLLTDQSSIHSLNSAKTLIWFDFIPLDITYGKENVPVSCVNSIDRSNPEYVEYSTVRTPREGVNLNLDSNFLSCCDCTDDCQDKEKCQCWQMTIQVSFR